MTATWISKARSPQYKPLQQKPNSHLLQDKKKAEEKRRDGSRAGRRFY
jgi:hypothetical protein